MSREITIYLSEEIDNFITTLSFEEGISEEEVIVEILRDYYTVIQDEYDDYEIPNELFSLKNEEGLLTISDTYKKKFNESE
ncbi:hypothetical protein [Acetohalobium arabaticum]|uniref:CopG domain protein DNA-binding domain protein n=1 Tax=Acetohalobium arabaticum (strain ATCC 49924 / DSM 5501 / Z-7288) TaxID=574087 RepID=D9QQA7_ACEAZ|nr:hypothetical protein [Acetohalobium arabaticum]ADL12698.1 hypothetical protein Acear_1176 [Acetohalobium arabaticum DSM 5501]